MSKRKIFITEFDQRRLEELIGVGEATGDLAREDLCDLQRELARAKVVSTRQVPAGVVTMNSQVELTDVDTQARMTYTLVFPAAADYDQGRISVLAPVGTAILGYAEGDIVEWPVPAGKRRLRIDKVIYQPEAAGDYHL